MKFRHPSFGMIVFFGLFIAGFSLIAFASTNAGVAPKHGLDEFGGDRYLAPPVIFGILLSMHSVAIGALAKIGRAHV